MQHSQSPVSPSLSIPTRLASSDDPIITKASAMPASSACEIWKEDRWSYPRLLGAGL